MKQQLVTPFDTIESAQDFVRVLAETIVEAKQEIEVDLGRELQSPPSRRTKALQIAVYNLDRLEKQMTRSRRILNDLRSLRRLLFAEREFHRVKAIGTNEKPETTPPLISAIPAPQRIGRSSVSGVRMSSSPPAAA